MSKSYSVYHNFMDVPFRFAGSFESKKKASAAADAVKAENWTAKVYIIPEAAPAYQVGQQVTGWNERPKGYENAIRHIKKSS